MIDASMIVQRVVAEVGGAGRVVSIQRAEDMLLLYRKPRLTYIINGPTVQVIVDGRPSAVLHYAGHIAIESAGG